MVCVLHGERVRDPKFSFSNSRRKREARMAAQLSAARLAASGRSSPAAHCRGPASQCRPRAAVDPPCRAAAPRRLRPPVRPPLRPGDPQRRRLQRAPVGRVLPWRRLRLPLRGVGVVGPRSAIHAWALNWEDLARPRRLLHSCSGPESASPRRAAPAAPRRRPALPRRPRTRLAAPVTRRGWTLAPLPSKSAARTS
jgi:hypothetical protein